MGMVVQTLDSVHGRPATGVKARLERAEPGGWQVQGEAETDADGCVGPWRGLTFTRGLYRIEFDSDRYFVSLGISAAYPMVSVKFRVTDDGDPHQAQTKIVLTLAPFAYSTYISSHG